MDSDDLFLRLEEWSGKIQQRVDEYKGTVEAVNTLMVVAAFIAGVQAQIISYTLQLPQSVLGRSANFFAFVGLMLEISGTFLGAVHMLFLQRKIKDGTRVLSSVNQCQADLKIIAKAVLKKEQKRRRQEQAEKRDEVPDERELEGVNVPVLFPNSSGVYFEHSSITVNTSVNQTPVVDDVNDYADRARNVKQVLEGMEFRYRSLAPLYIVEKILELIEKVLPAAPTAAPQRQDTRLTIVDITPIMRPVFTYGNTPLMSMAAGVAALAISTILLSVASNVLKTEVWIGCVGALVGVMVLSSLPTSASVSKLFATSRTRPSTTAGQRTR